MAGINKVILLGRLGKDPEIRYLPDGTPVASFSIATSESWTDKNSGQKKESTEWHNIVAWRKLAEICAKYLTKGKQVYVEGKLKTESWERDGVKHYSTKVQIHEMQMIGTKGNGASEDQDSEEEKQARAERLYREDMKLRSQTGNTPETNSGVKQETEGDVPF
jgi:single-strand DNA-binding protein